MELRHLLLAFAVAAVPLCIVAILIAKSWGLLLLSAAVVALLLVAIAAAAAAAWPLAYLAIAIAYWARPDVRAPSVDYSIDQGREAEKGRGKGADRNR